MQIAKMFASLGFKVDTAGLVVFKKAIADARKELTNLNQSAKNSTRQLRNLKREVNNLSAAMAKIRGTTGSGKVTQAYQSMAGSAHKLNNALNAIVLNRKNITNAIGKINSSIFAGLNHWDRYRTSVVQTRRAILNLNREISRLRANARVRVDINRNGGGGGSGGGGGEDGDSGLLGSLLGGLGLRGLAGNFIPSMAIASVGGGVGYGAKMMVEANRENTRMESMILMTSKSSAEYKDTIDYINKEGLRLGLSVSELGKSFAQISMSAEKLSQTEKKEMFTGFSEFMMSMGTSADDQKGIFRAFNQMFSNNRILQEEINQLSDRGIPATLIYDAAMKEYGLDTVAQVKKLQEAGKLDPSRVLTAMSKSLQAKAHDSGAFDRMKESSIFKQNQFMAEMRKFSVETMSSGLDKQLGNIFGVLTRLVQEVRELTVVLSTLTGFVLDGKDAIKEYTGISGYLQLAITILTFRYKKLIAAAARALIVLRSGGRWTRALGELMNGVLGRALKMLIIRFSGWIGVLITAWLTYKLLYKEIQKSKLGDWNFFDAVALQVDILTLKFKIFLEDLRYMKALITTGNLGDFSAKGIFKTVVDSARDRVDPNAETFSQKFPNIAKAVDKVGRVFSKGVDDKVATPNSVLPSQATSYYEKNRPINITNIANFEGVQVGEETSSFLVPQY